MQFFHGLSKPGERRIGKNVNGSMRDQARISENVRAKQAKMGEDDDEKDKKKNKPNSLDCW